MYDQTSNLDLCVCLKEKFAFKRKNPLWAETIIQYFNIHHIGMEDMQQVPFNTMPPDYYNSAKMQYKQ